MGQNNFEKSSEDLFTIIKSWEIFKEFSQESLAELSAKLTPVSIKKDKVLFHQGDPGDAMYIVVKGALQASIVEEDGEKKTLEEVRPKMMSGLLQMLEGGNYTATLTSIDETELLKLKKSDFINLANIFPDLIEQMAKILRYRLWCNQIRPVILKLLGKIEEDTFLDIASKTERVHLHRGEALFLQGDGCDDFYIVISGALQTFVNEENTSWPFGAEIKRGEFVGEMELWIEEERETNVYAVRDSYLLKFSKQLITDIFEQYPDVMKKITQILIRRQRGAIRFMRRSGSAAPPKSTGKNFTVFSDNRDVPLSDFSDKLVSALSSHGSVLYLNSERINAYVGKPGIAQKIDSIRLNTWLVEKESNYDFIVFEADISSSPWTKKCIHHADQVLIVTQANGNAKKGLIESELLKPVTGETPAKQVLVLLHPDGSKPPTGTKRFLSERSIDQHHHIRWDNDADFKKLARFLSGQAIGVVLSGGSARGFAHFGVLRAIDEMGVPIDMIGGTSAGAAAAMAYALNWDNERIIDFVNKEFVEKKAFKEFTLPIVSLIKGKKMEKALQKAFEETRLEDLWLNTFCVSSNLSTQKTNVHQRGIAWEAVRASVSLPGILEPVVNDFNILADGGILNNLPGDVMRNLCRGYLIAVDVTEENEFKIDYSTYPSPWKILLSRILPFMKKIAVPNMLDILIQSIVLSSIKKKEMVKLDADLYLNPPVFHFENMNFSAGVEITNVAFEYAVNKIKEWKEKEGIEF